MKVTKETIIRTILLAVALVNQILTMCDVNPLPFSEEELYEVCSTIFTAATSLWAWWKNNSFSKAALQGDEIMNEIRKEDKEQKKLSKELGE